jgi:hypothetical protein
VARPKPAAIEPLPQAPAPARAQARVLAQPEPPPPRLAAAGPIDRLDPAFALALGLGIALIVASALPRVVSASRERPGWLDRVQLAAGVGGLGCALAAVAVFLAS